MKLLLPAALCLTASLFAGCGSLDNPFAGFNLFGTGSDARVYNSQTGEFEWPADSTPKRKSAPRTAATGALSTPPPRKGDGRYFDLQKGQWVDATEDVVSPRKSRVKNPPPPASAPGFVTTGGPMATPPPPAPARASGVYNSSTGRIEWNTTGAAPAPTPKPKQGWRLWPF